MGFKEIHGLLLSNTYYKRFFLIFTFFYFSYSSYSQINVGGKPMSAIFNLPQNIAKYTTKEIDHKKLFDEDKFDESKDIPPRFGYGIETSISLKEKGSLHIIENKGKVWRLRIESKNALSINLIYSYFDIPKGALFYIYTDNYEQVLGGFTNYNVQSHKKFSTSLTKGSSCLLEYYEPFSVEKEGKIIISSIVHGYKDLFKVAKDFGTSGSCNNNVNCPEGTPWQNDKRSIAMVVLANGTRWCTGAVVNNTNQDATPYFLTANHCLTGSENTWIYYFNYESPSCANIDGPTNQTVSGSTLLASNSASDFALLQLSSIPPVSYNVYYSGWDKRDLIKDSTVAIHHPDGDIKKISFDYDFNQSSGYFGAGNDHWKILDWDDGTTEGGSSGSPLYDKKHRIIGQLHGGNASCSNNLEDYYGKFSLSWNNGTIPSSRLKDWLDPLNTNVDTLDGRYFTTAFYVYDASIINTSSVSTPSCDTTFTPSFKLTNLGDSIIHSITYNYNFDGASSNSSWTGSISYLQSISITLPNLSFQAGNHLLEVIVTSINGLAVDQNPLNDTIRYTFNSIDGNLLDITLRTDNWGGETSFNIKDSSNVIIYDATSFADNATVNIPICLSNGCYTFEISDSYGDGICCNYGNGFFKLDINGDSIHHNDGQFGSSFTYSFCLKCNQQVQSMSDTCSTTVGFIAEKIDKILVIYPNPANGYFNIEIPFNESNLEIYNMLGKIVYFEELKKSNQKITIQNLPKGIYFVKVVSNKTVITKKIQITR